MSKYIRTPAYPDAMPVDISFVFEGERPAGKHGFMKADGDQFRFEDGTLARFWGVNLNGGANFPEHDYAQQLARRLAQAGCNIARFHQLDAEWNTPNIFAYTKGRRLTTTRKLDPVSMDHLDYLIYCLKNEGIYVYLDMMTYRKFKSGDGVPHADELRDSAKPYSIFNRRLIELQKEYCDQLWNHYNPYTKLHYKDDPVFVMSEITNECDLFRRVANKGADSPYYENEFRQLFKDWLEEKNIEYDWETCEMYAQEPVLVDFKIELTMKYYAEMRDYMRSIGVKVPITGTNWPQNAPGNTIAQRDLDYVDSHHYYYDWRWGEEDKFGANAQINGQKTIMYNAAYQRVNNRPFFISEWDTPWPNSYRAEGPIYYAAVSALQDWSGMAIHTYAYGSRLDKMDILGKELSPETIAGVPYRTGIFSVWNDPAKFGLFYHASLIVRRCDISPADKKIGVTITNKQKMLTNAYKTGLEMHRLALLMEGEEPVGCDEVINDADKLEWEKAKIVMSDNGQVWRNISKMCGGIDTPRTKVVYGKLSGGYTDQAASGTAVDGMRVDGKTDFGVVALSSLTDEPIEKSDNMLLSTIGRARNTDAVFDGDKMIDYGKAPILSEVINAKISIRTERTDLKVWGISPEGHYVGCLPATYENGCLTFTVGEKYFASYYLIVAE